MTQVIGWTLDSRDGVYISGGDPKLTNHTPSRPMPNSFSLLNLIQKVTPRSIDILARHTQTQLLKREVVHALHHREYRQSINLEGMFSNENNFISLDNNIDARTGRAVNWDVYGSDSDDFVRCGDGDDNIWSGGGRDHINAGHGRNNVYAGTGGGIFGAGSGNDAFYMPEEDQARSLFEFYGNAGDDLLTVQGDYDDQVLAKMGDDSDVIFGGKPRGSYWTGRGNDFVGTSVLHQKVGDFIMGGRGSDLLIVDAANPGGRYTDRRAAHFGDFYNVGDRIEIGNLGNRGWNLSPAHGSTRRSPEFMVRDDENRAIVKISGYKVFGNRTIWPNWPDGHTRMDRRVVVAYDHDSLEVIHSELATPSNIGFEFIHQLN